MPNLKLEVYPLLDVHNWLWNISAVILHIWRHFPPSATWGCSMSCWRGTQVTSQCDWSINSSKMGDLRCKCRCETYSKNLFLPLWYFQNGWKCNMSLEVNIYYDVTICWLSSTSVRAQSSHLKVSCLKYR